MRPGISRAEFEWRCSRLSQIPRTMLRQSTLEISRLAFGLGAIHRIPFRRQRQYLIDAAYGLGITHFDSAPSYGDGLAERELGRFLRRRRDSVTVATKFGLTSRDLFGRAGIVSHPARAVRGQLAQHGLIHWPRRDYSARAMKGSLELSLSLLGLDFVDILFLHDPPQAFAPDDDLLGELLATKTAGRVRLLGVSGGFALDCVQRCPHVFDVIQTEEAVWDPAGAVQPDLTYGVMRNLDVPGTTREQDRARIALARAFARRAEGAVVISTSDLNHLYYYAVAATDLARK